MRVSFVKDDPAYARTEWIRVSGAKIIVTIDGEQVDEVITADEELGVVAFRVGVAAIVQKGKVFIRISLRD